MEHTLASREAVEKFAGLSLDGILVFLKRAADMILDGDYGQAIMLADSVRATYGLTTETASKSSPEDIETGTSDPKATTTELTFRELEKRSQILGTAATGFTGETIQRPTNTPRKQRLGLQQWLSASDSRASWILGPPTTSKPSDLSSLSDFLASTLTRAKVPLIAHKCQRSESEQGALISMVFSVITQLIWLLPENFSTNKDSSLKLVNLLDRIPEKVPLALGVMEDLLALAPPLLVVIIDGIQLCEDGVGDVRGTALSLSYFITVLNNGGKDQKVLKTLFTTDDVCECLWLKFGDQAQVDVGRETGGTAEHRRKGRNVMG